jgi:ComF family protein
VILDREFSAIKSALAQIFFPPVCYVCNEPVESLTDQCLCPSCLESIEHIVEPFCDQCGMPFPAASHTDSPLCGQCLANPPAYKQARYGIVYTEIVRSAVVRFKYQKATYLARPLSNILLESFNEFYDAGHIDLITPVPLHVKRLRNRGFNQALLLAEQLAKRTGLDLERNVVRKMKDTRPQVGLKRAERNKNLRGCFRVHDPEIIRGRRVLIVDDVATTGTTVGEAAKTVMKAGAHEVAVLVLALRTKFTDNVAQQKAVS